MNNLIVTIIALALTAVAAVMTIYYVNTTFQNATIQATANAIMNEAQQITQAERMTSTLIGQPDISGMGTAGASGTGMSGLINNKALLTWPSLAGNNIAFSINLDKPGIQPSVGSGTAGAGTVSTGTWDSGCYSSGGYYGRLMRFLVAYNSQNYVVYEFAVNIPYSAPCSSISNGFFITYAGDTSQANHPIIKIAKAINASMNQIPATATISTVGIPISPAGSAPPTTAYDSSASNQISHIVVDANGNMQTNYCYFASPTYSNLLMCVFGPS